MIYMAQISVNNLTFCYEGSFDNIFEDVSFSIDTNWKLGFIGRNGKGKTTFLNLLLGKYEYVGSINTSTVFDYFPYRVTERQMRLPAAEFMEELKAGCEQWRVICELAGLEEDAEILYRPYGTLSHGERTKVLLAILFSGENDFLLIDEPTNHLDKEAREVVKRYLSSKKGFILVSHDRDLLDTCTDHCLVLNRGSIEVQSGNFSTWWENKKRKDGFALAENEKHRREIQNLKASAARISQWADKSEGTKIGYDPVKEHDRSIATRAYIGTKTKKMQSRVKQMNRRISKEIQEKEGLLQDLETPVDLKLMQLSHYKNALVNVKEYGLKYTDANGPMFEDLTFSIEKGDRIALSGKNGCGKTTLINMILQKAGYGQTGAEISRAGMNITGAGKCISEAGLHISETGICETAPNLVISYVGQDASGLKGDIETYCKSNGLDKSLFLAILRQLDFERVQFLKNMEEYSEGQKKKVLLATSLLTPAHLYIWDEPLNYIDVFSRMQIEKLLLTYQPTMLFVEHDVKFCEKIATRRIKL